MAITQPSTSQIVNRSALTGIGSAANAGLDTILALLNTQTNLATASTLMKRDANANVNINSLIESAVSIATAAGTTTLTVASAYFQQFTGSTTQTVVLPAATTLAVGQAFCVANRSTGNVTIQQNGGTVLQVLASNSQATVTCTNVSTSAGVWDSAYSLAGALPFLKVQTLADATTTGSLASLQAVDITVGVVKLTNSSLVSVSGIPAGSDGQNLIVENITGNSITLNNNDSTVTSANRIFTGTNGNVTMSNTATYEFSYDATAAKWMLVGGTGSGSGSGSGKNYLSVYTASTSTTPNVGNGNFEAGSTSGWSLAHSALTSLIPSTVGAAGVAFSATAGGSAASGNLSFATVSSGQLAGAYSGSLVSSAASTAGDMLISSAFNIDLEDQAKVQTVKFYYKLVSGTGTSFAGTSANTFAVYVYDVTNAQWIQPAGVYGMTQNSGVGYCTATFQTSSNSTQYQLALVNINASTTAYTLYVDDFVLGPQTAPLGAAETDWISYTPVITATTTNPTFGTISANSASWRREGDSMRIRYTFRQTSAGTAGSGVYLFSLPPGYSLNVAKINTGSASGGSSNPYVMGSGFFSSGDPCSVLVAANGSLTQINLQNGATLFGSTSSATDIFSNANASFGFDALIPIQGWSSNVQMSSDTDTRVVAMRAYGTATSSLTTAYTPLIGIPMQSDTHGTYNASTGQYTIPISGYYDVSAQANLGGTASVGSLYYLDLYNVTTSTEIQSADLVNSAAYSGYTVVTLNSKSVYLNAGSIIVLRVQYSGTVTAPVAAGSQSLFSVSRVSGPSVIAASESVNGLYASTSGASIQTASPYAFSTLVRDTHGAYNSGVLTIPVSGMYAFSVQMTSASTALSAGNNFQLQLTKNGTVMQIVNNQASASLTQTLQNAISISFPCNANDTVRVVTSTTVAMTSNTGAGYNNFSWVRTGN